MTRHEGTRVARTWRAIAITVALPLAVAACAPVPPGTKAGGGLAPVTIQLATADPEGTFGSASLIQFADRVEEYSRGSVEVEIEWQAYQRVTDVWDPAGFDIVADLVSAGDADIALTPEWVWITRGAPSLAALRTPFLVDRMEVLQQIAASDIAERMLGDLAEHGVRGLALLPQGLRHPLSFEEPVLEPDDLAGEPFRAVDSLAADLFRTLGAEVRVLDGNDYFSSVARGEIRGADASVATASVHPELGTVTADLAYFPMTAVVVANADWFESLAPDVRAILEDASAETRESVIASTISPAAAAEAYCETGGAVALAGAVRIALWEDAVAPVRERLESDPATFEAIAAIEALARETPPERLPVRACDGASASPSPTASAPSEAFPDGVYRADIPMSAFLDAGVDAQTAYHHAGIWTLTFRDGVWEATDPQTPVHDCPGSTYSVEQGRVVVTLGENGTSCGGSAGRELFSAAWEHDGTTLRFVDVRAGAGGGSDAFAQVLFGSTPWVAVE